MDFLENIGIIIGIIVGVISGVIYIYKSAKSTAKGIDEETIKTYEKNYDALTKRIELIEAENRELHAQINQLIGENRALKDTLSLRDPKFTEEMTKGFKCMAEILLALKAHDAQAVEIKCLTQEMNIDIKAIRSFCDEKASPILEKIRDNNCTIRKSKKG
jgi:predicted RNase H-like nuclease (RuvC/YqgF family)